MTQIIRGNTYRIFAIKPLKNKTFKTRLLALGLIPGACFTVLRFAPLRSPIQIKINQFTVSIREQDLSALQFEECEHAD